MLTVPALGASFFFTSPLYLNLLQWACITFIKKYYFNKSMEQQAWKQLSVKQERNKDLWVPHTRSENPYYSSKYIQKKKNSPRPQERASWGASEKTEWGREGSVDRLRKPQLTWHHKLRVTWQAHVHRPSGMVGSPLVQVRSSHTEHGSQNWISGPPVEPPGYPSPPTGTEKGQPDREILTWR